MPHFAYFWPTPGEEWSAGLCRQRRNIQILGARYAHTSPQMLSPWVFTSCHIAAAHHAPKTGSNRAQNTANKLGDSLFFFNVCLGFFMVYSKMANVGFWTYCNIFLSMCGTSKKSTKQLILRSHIYYRNTLNV